MIIISIHMKKEQSSSLLFFLLSSEFQLLSLIHTLEIISRRGPFRNGTHKRKILLVERHQREFIRWSAIFHKMSIPIKRETIINSQTRSQISRTYLKISFSKRWTCLCIEGDARFEENAVLPREGIRKSLRSYGTKRRRVIFFRNDALKNSAC